MKVTFKRNGEIFLCGWFVGVWSCRDLWEENGGRTNKSGCKLVHYLWQTWTIDGKAIFHYSQRDAKAWILCNYERLARLAKGMSKEKKDAMIAATIAVNNAK